MPPSRSTFRKRNAFAITDTGERLMAAPAIVKLHGASIDVEVLEAPTLVGVVVAVIDGDGAAVEGVSIEGRGVHGGRIEGSTNERGEFSAQRVPLGRYLVSASDLERGRVEGWVALERDASNRCTLQLRR